MNCTLNLAAAARCDDITANQRLWSVFEAFNYSLGEEWVRWIQKTPPPYKHRPCPKSRPCRYFGCRYHLAMERLRSGNLKLTHPELTLKQLPFTCLWDVIEAHPHGMYEREVGQILGINRGIVRMTVSRVTKYPRVRCALRRFVNLENAANVPNLGTNVPISGTKRG